MDQIRNEFQEKEKEKEKRIYNLDKDFTEFKEQNQVTIDIGKKLLKLSETKKWRGSICARRLYGLAYAQLPAASAKYVSQLIPVTIAAFFCDAGIDTHFENLEFIADTTPCDKKLSECVMLLHELVKYKIADYTNKGAIWSLVHDKGDRNKLGRLIRVLSMLNKFGRFDPYFNDGVVSIKIDADGVACKDDDLISHIENTFRGIEPYLKHLDSAKIIEISSFTTVMLVVVEVQKKRALSNIGTRRMGGFTLLCTHLCSSRTLKALGKGMAICIQ